VQKAKLIHSWVQFEAEMQGTVIDVEPANTKGDRDNMDLNEARIEAFNKMNKVGSPVTVVKDFGELFETSVKHPAEMMAETPVVWIKGISGAYALNRVIGGEGLPVKTPSMDTKSDVIGTVEDLVMSLSMHDIGKLIDNGNMTFEDIEQAFSTTLRREVTERNV